MKQESAVARPSQSGRASLAAACCVLLWLTACEPNASPPPPPFESASVRKVVPLARPFELVATAEPQVVEFELPPPGNNASTTLTLGLRVSGPDGLQSLAAAEAIERAGLAAKLSLTGMDGNTAVPLVRVDYSGRGPVRWLPVGADEAVPAVEGSSVDVTSLEQVGLVQAGREYRELVFARAEDMKPGRYQLKIQVVDPAPTLATAQVELLVAYQHRSK